MISLKEFTGMPKGAKSFPQISLVFPFELKMNKQLPLMNMLTLAANEVEKKLTSKYPEELVKVALKKLRHLIAGVHCRKDKMSMCILVSPLAEKVYYFLPRKELSNYYPPSN